MASKRYFGFNCQQYGDLIINTVAARALKLAEPSSHLTFCIAGEYADCSQLFLHHPNIDAIRVLNKSRGGFDDIDKKWLESEKFDKAFEPMKGHGDSSWWEKRHQTQEVCAMHGLEIPANYQCELNNWFSDKIIRAPKRVAFLPYAGSYSKDNDKMLKPPKAQRIVSFLIELGYSVLQLGAQFEIALDGAIKRQTSFFDSVVNMMGCDFLVSTDSGICWTASAYSFPCIGLYSRGKYGNNIKNIQPINPNASYLDANNVNDIDDKDLFPLMERFCDRY